MSGHVYDLAVIGGGVNGCGIARDAAGRGLDVVVVEKGDLAGATSSASTKLATTCTLAAVTLRRISSDSTPAALARPLMKLPFRGRVRGRGRVRVGLGLGLGSGLGLGWD